MDRVLAGFLVLLLFGLTACEQDYVPKPRAYYRIDFPEKSYKQLENDCPYTFEYPTYAEITNDMKGDEKFCWLNVDYKPFNATLHVSYKPIIEEDDIQFLINDAYTFVSEHNKMAEKITEERIENQLYDAGGLLFKIGGNTASNLQFFLTDTTQHFLRASLYFNCEPNKDSLAPVVEYIEKDIQHLVNTFEWTGKSLEEFR
ncbi:MAG: gliding motility lipoprotein GldD [Bacteroidia bacterium]